MKQIRAVIADDEEALRDYLKIKLSVLWSELIICGEAGDGVTALKLIENIKPDIAFLDIKMPGLSGIEVARRISVKCLPVFITAYDEYAVKAFEAGAIDYLLKPVTDKRLEKTVKRLQNQIADPSMPLLNISEILEKMSLTAQKPRGHLQWIKVQHKDGVRLIPVDEIHYFKAADKYTTVKTRDREFLIRKTIMELFNELSHDQFWQIHRATIVNVAKIDMVIRTLTGGYEIRLKDLHETLSVSRSFSYLFKQM